MPKKQTKQEEQITELTADLQRLQADFANFKRRSTEERGEFVNVAKQQAMAELLPILDNLDRAIAHMPEELAETPWAKGVAQVAKQVGEKLAGLGVEKIEALGQPFDPNLHEAIEFQEGEGTTEVVTEELQPGYKIGDRLLRPAIVKVGRK